MFKRTNGNRENEYSLPVKRAKYDTKKETLVGVSKSNRGSINEKSVKRSDDVWGDDFAEEDIEEMDYVASQACLEV